MQRIIKFRGKRVDNGEWVYGSLIDECYILQYIDLAESWTPLTSDHKVTCRAYAVDPKTIGQFTGLKDKSGNEIYEGDIMLSDGGITIMACFSSDNPALTMGWYLKNFSGFSCMFTPSTGNHCEVIGNIHDNPELLNPPADSPALNTMTTDPNVKTDGEVKDDAADLNAAPAEATEGTDEKAAEG